MVRAKFTYCGYDAILMSRSQRDADGNDMKGEDGRVLYEQVEMRTLKFSPVYANNDPKHENSLFWRASPGGKVEMNCVNPEAWKQFELGKEYYLDFSLVG
jgi:hypothetical protein